MAFENLVAQAVTSDGAGAVSVTVPNSAFGKLKKVRYVHNAVTMTGTPGIVVAGAKTGAVMLTATIGAGATDQEWAPQQLSAKSTDGTATTTFTDIVVAEDILLTMSGCGAAKKATIYFWIGD